MVHNGYMSTESDKREQEFFDLAERFRSATDPGKSNGWAMSWGAWSSGADADPSKSS
jgi:hypothetical protein